MEKLYHIIRVFGYKGGELHTQFNLDYEEFISELGFIFIERYFNDKFDQYDEFNVETFSKLKEKNSKGEILNYISKIVSEYAGSGLVYECYYTENNQMIELTLTQEIIDAAVDSFIISNI